MVVYAPDAVPMSAAGVVLVTALVIAGMAAAKPAPIMLISAISAG
jgi:hypothetical protein